MTALGLVAPAATVLDNVGVASGSTTGATGRSTSQQWSIRKEKIKDRQLRLCLCCGRGEARYQKLEIHHAKRRFNGGTNSWSNTAAVCHACHRAVHNIGDRYIPLAGRIILALQVVGPRESKFILSICKLIFRCFLRSAAETVFHPSAPQVRPAVQTPGGLVEIPAEAV